VIGWEGCLRNDFNVLSGTLNLTILILSLKTHQSVHATVPLSSLVSIQFICKNSTQNAPQSPPQTLSLVGRGTPPPHTLPLLPFGAFGASIFESTAVDTRAFGARLPNLQQKSPPLPGAAVQAPLGQLTPPSAIMIVIALLVLVSSAVSLHVSTRSANADCTARRV